MTVLCVQKCQYFNRGEIGRVKKAIPGYLVKIETKKGTTGVVLNIGERHLTPIAKEDDLRPNMRPSTHLGFRGLYMAEKEARERVLGR